MNRLNGIKWNEIIKINILCISYLTNNIVNNDGNIRKLQSITIKLYNSNIIIILIKTCTIFIYNKYYIK